MRCMRLMLQPRDQFLIDNSRFHGIAPESAKKYVKKQHFLSSWIGIAPTTRGKTCANKIEKKIRNDRPDSRSFAVANMLRMATRSCNENEINRTLGDFDIFTVTCLPRHIAATMTRSICNRKVGLVRNNWLHVSPL